MDFASRCKEPHKAASRGDGISFIRSNASCNCKSPPRPSISTMQAQCFIYLWCSLTLCCETLAPFINKACIVTSRKNGFEIYVVWLNTFLLHYREPFQRFVHVSLQGMPRNQYIPRNNVPSTWMNIIEHFQGSFYISTNGIHVTRTFQGFMLIFILLCKNKIMKLPSEMAVQK